MPLSDLTFGVFENATLTTPFSGELLMTHESDLSDNPQDFVLYFGSLTADRQLEDNTNPGVDDIFLTPTYELDGWTASTAYVVGDCIIPSTSDGFRYVCAVAGTSDITEPTFNTGIGSTTTDNDVTWTTTAIEHVITEVTLALTLIGLDSAVAGDPLNMGTTILSEVANELEIHIRVNNTVTTVSDNAACPEIGLEISEIIETAI